MKKLIIGIILVLFTIGIGSIISLYFVGDKIVEEALIGDTEKMLEDDNFNLDTSIDNSGKENNSTLGVDSKSKTETNGNKVAIGEESVNKNGNLNNQDKNTNKAVQSNDKKVITVAKMKKINKSVPKVKKIEVAATVVNRLSFTEMAELKGMAQGGLTGQEKDKVKGIIYNKFSKKEIQEMRNLYEKYKK